MFDWDRFQSRLATRHLGRHFAYLSEASSTMDVARDLATRGAVSGTVVLAETQTAGRGRKGRAFYSPDGDNLYFTLVLHVSPEELRGATVAVPLAVCHACSDVGVEARIKWPNDIWVGERKVCGMLLDAETSAKGSLLFPGIGINVNGDPAINPELRDIATSLAVAAGRPIDREEVLASTCNEIERWLDADAAARIAAYRELSMVIGRDVTLTDPGGQSYVCHATGIQPDGSLEVRLASGATQTVAAGEVTLRPTNPS